MRYKLSILLFCLLAANTQAQPVSLPIKTATSKTPVHIKADQFSFDRKSNKVIFTGQVKITQDPSTVILADTLWLFTTDERALKKAVFFGNPVDYHVDKTPQQAETHATATTMIYDNEKQLVTLSGNAFVQQGDNSFSGPVIRYDLQHKVVVSEATPTQKVSVELLVDQKQNPLLRTPQ